MIARLVVAGLVVMVALSAAADWGAPCEATWSEEDKVLQRVTTVARCAFHMSGTTTQDTSVKVYGKMTVSPGSAGALCQGWGYCGMGLAISPYTAGTTYTTNGTFTATQAGISFSTKTVTASKTMDPPQRPRTDPENPGDPEGGCDQDCTPILINLADGPWKLSDADDPVFFDIDANGAADRITWTGRGEPLAFLARIIHADTGTGQMPT